LRLERVAGRASDTVNQHRPCAFFSPKASGDTIRPDHDVRPSENMRVVQMTPPGSACAVVLGEGLRGELAGRGVGISEAQQVGPDGTPGRRRRGLIRFHASITEREQT
jgi:hypothetical protein